MEIALWTVAVVCLMVLVFGLIRETFWITTFRKSKKRKEVKAMTPCKKLEAVERPRTETLRSDRATCHDDDIYLAVYKGRVYKHQARVECPEYTGATEETHRWLPVDKCRNKFFGTHDTIQDAINAVIAKGGEVFHITGQELNAAVLEFLNGRCG